MRPVNCLKIPVKPELEITVRPELEIPVRPEPVEGFSLDKTNELQIALAKRIATLHAARLQTSIKPTGALLAGAVGEAVWAHIAG
jgi:hypothetical protein